MRPIMLPPCNGGCLAWTRCWCTGRAAETPDGHGNPSGVRCIGIGQLPLPRVHHLAVFLGERTRHRRQDLQHDLGGTAQPGAQRRLHERPVDQDRVGQHRVQQCVVAERRVAQPQRVIGRALLPDGIANAQARRCDQFDQARAAGRVGQVVDDLRFDAHVPEHRQRVARGAAIGVVVNDGVHAPSVWFKAASTTPAAAASATASTAPLRSL